MSFKKWRVCAIPTETVYGLAANAINADACKKIFIAKGRPLDNPLIVHISDMEMFNDCILKYLTESEKQIVSNQQGIIDTFWPGPLTIIIPRPSNIPLEVTAGQNTLAIRMPAHPIARRLIKACGFPLAAPSANTSGRPSPTLAEHVLDDMNFLPVLDGGQCSSGLESTILNAINEIPCILRPGGVTFEELQVYIPNIICTTSQSLVVTPGMKYKHYSPNAIIYLIEKSDKQASIIQERIGLISTSNNRQGIIRTNTQVPYTAPMAVDIYLGSDPKVIAKNLFKTFRDLEYQGVTHIFIEGISEENQGAAVMNRIRKAAENV